MPEFAISSSHTTRSRLIILAAVFGFLGVAAGAFGAHALEGMDSASLATFDTAVRYQLTHALALLAMAALADRPSGLAWRAGLLFAVGIVLFSGSLYALVFTGVTAFGAVTPLGGVALLLGWAALGWSAFRTKSVGS